MQLVTQRERDLVARVGPLLLRRFDELEAEWRDAWEDMTGLGVPADLPHILRVAITEGLDRGLELERDVAGWLIDRNVPLDQLVSAVLLWEEVLHRRLARDALEDVFATAAALTRFLHELVLLVAEGYSGAFRRARDDIKKGLEETDRLKTELISMISHDLKTPLTTIEACAESMLKATDLEEPQRRRFLEMILRNAERLTRLITRIVDVSRIEAGAMELRIAPLDLGSVTGRIVETILPWASVELEFPEGLPPVLADREAVERIVVNLIDNAVRFSPGGEPVVVRAQADSTHVELRVLDRGRGIPADRRSGLFSKFFQVDPSPSARRSGSGLGLAIVRGLASAMGGDAGYLPNMPEGSVFWVRLPAAQQSFAEGQEAG